MRALMSMAKQVIGGSGDATLSHPGCATTAGQDRPVSSRRLAIFCEALLVVDMVNLKPHLGMKLLRCNVVNTCTGLEEAGAALPRKLLGINKHI